MNEATEVHDVLNPQIWTEDGKLHPDVEKQLYKIVDAFVDFCDIKLEIVDVHLVGSNASFNYNSKSDLDLHIVVNFSLMPASKEILQVALNREKAAFNDYYDISVKGVKVELYVEDINSGTMSNGIYSLFMGRWIKFPKPIIINKNVDFSDTLSKWENKKDNAIKNKDADQVKTLINTAYMIRKNSLAIDGEYGNGNLLFKELRSSGILQDLKDALRNIQSDDLSLEQYNKLNEDTRAKLLSTSKSTVKGSQRFKKRIKSRVANQVKQFNDINMNKLFKEDILDINIQVKGETDDYSVRLSFGGFLEELRKNLGENQEISIPIILKSLVMCFNRNDVYMHCTCLHPDTLIDLVDGEVIPVKELADRFNDGEEFFVWSIDKHKNLVRGLVEKAWITGYEKDFIKITLGNSEYVITTKDHLYMLDDGSYCMAQKLTVGTSLMLGQKIINIKNVLYDEPIPVYDIKVKDYHNFKVEAKAILHNCPDWRFRYDYVAREINKTNSQEKPDDPQNRPARIRNPHNNLGSGCKHTLLVLSNKSWIIKVASVINNYIIYMQKHYNRQYADLIYPAIYGKEYEEPVQLQIDDNSNDLDSTRDTVDKSNEYGRTRTQFQKGNTQGIRFASKEKEDPDQINLNI